MIAYFGIATGIARPRGLRMSDYEQSIPTRQSLLSRLKDWDDRASWQDFFDTYWRLIYGTARKAGLSDSESQDVVQETLLTVCKNIGEFHYDSSKGHFKSWLLKTTAWKIGDHFRKRSKAILQPLDTEVSDEEGASLSASAPDEMAQSWELDWEKNLMDAAVERVRKKIPPKHFQIFDLTAVKGWPAQRVAATLNTNAGYVYVIAHRVKARIKKEVKKLKNDPCLQSDAATRHRTL